MTLFHTGAKSRIPVLLAIVMVVFFCSGVIAEEQVRPTSIRPTVFFVRQDGVLAQLLEATMNNLSQDEVKITLQYEVSGQSLKVISASVSKGTTTTIFSFPDIGEPTPVTFALTVDGTEYNRHCITWQRQRKWDMYFIPITHHDLGYYGNLPG